MYFRLPQNPGPNMSPINSALFLLFLSGVFCDVHFAPPAQAFGIGPPPNCPFVWCVRRMPPVTSLLFFFTGILCPYLRRPSKDLTPNQPFTVFVCCDLFSFQSSRFLLQRRIRHSASLYPKLTAIRTNRHQKAFQGKGPSPHRLGNVEGGVPPQCEIQF